MCKRIFELVVLPKKKCTLTGWLVRGKSVDAELNTLLAIWGFNDAKNWVIFLKTAIIR